MRKNLLCHRCIVPLRVPMCTLTEVLWHIDYRDELEDMRLPQGLLPRSFNCKAHIYSLTFLTLWHVHDTSG